MSDDLIHEQQAPADGTGSDCWLLVLKDMQDRRRLGIEKYGKPVRADNGRDALTDAYQEELDKIVYLRQAIEQQRDLREKLDKAEETIAVDERCIRELADTNDFLRQDEESARREVAACHAIFAHLLRLCGHDPDSGHPMLIDAVHDALAKRDALIAQLRQAITATLGRLDYLRGLWGDEAITRSVCDMLRGAENGKDVTS